MKSESEVAQSCPTLCHPMDCSLPGSSVHGIFQARVLEWVAIAFSEAVGMPVYLHVGISSFSLGKLTHSSRPAEMPFQLTRAWNDLFLSKIFTVISIHSYGNFHTAVICENILIPLFDHRHHSIMVLPEHNKYTKNK